MYESEIVFLTNNSWCWKRQSWMQPNHARCLSLIVLFRIHFLTYKIVFIFSLTRFSNYIIRWCYGWHFNKRGCGIFESVIHTQGTGTENNVSIESIKSETFVEKKLVLKMLLIWKYINKKSSPIRKCMIEYCFLNNNIEHRIRDVQWMLNWRMLLILFKLLFTSFQTKLRLLFALKEDST